MLEVVGGEGLRAVEARLFFLGLGERLFLSQS